MFASVGSVRSIISSLTRFYSSLCSFCFWSSSLNFEADLMVMALAGALGAAALCAEKPSGHGHKKPKMPSVCEEHGIDFVTVSAFFRREPVAD